MSTSKRKQTQREALTTRLDRALGDLHHNASPRYPVAQNEYESRLFDEWFEMAAQSEIEYIQDGGAYQGYASTADWLRKGAHCEKCGARKARKFLAEMREQRERCNDLDTHRRTTGQRFSWKHGLIPNEDTPGYQYGTEAMWEYISEYGKLYQWGRGGRTLAPDRLICQRGGNSFSIEDAEGCYGLGPWDVSNWGGVVRLVRVVESFNRHVEAWCGDVPEMWKEEKETMDLQAEIDAHDGLVAHERRVTEWVKL